MAWRVWRIVEGFLTSMLNSSESGSSAFSGERKKAQVASLVTQTKNWGNPHKIEYLFNSWLLRSSHFLWVIFMLLQKLMPKSRNMTKVKTTWKQFHENITERKRQTNALFLDVFRKQFDQFCYIKPLKLDNEIWMCVKWKMEERKRLNTPPQAVCWLYDGNKHLHATHQTHLDVHAWIPPKTQANTENRWTKSICN